MANLAVMRNAVKRTVRIDWKEVRRRRWWPGFERELAIQRLLTCYGELTAFETTPRYGEGRWSTPKFMREFSDFADLHADESSLTTGCGTFLYLMGIVKTLLRVFIPNPPSEYCANSVTHTKFYDVRFRNWRPSLSAQVQRVRLSTDEKKDPIEP